MSAMGIGGSGDGGGQAHDGQAKGFSRRAFVQLSLAAGAAVAAAPAARLPASAATPAAGATIRRKGPYFFTAQEYATCGAICARLMPTDADPGARESGVVDFIDLFLAAFEVGPPVASGGPAIYLHGRFSNRNPLPGHPPPRDDMENLQTGERYFLPMTRTSQVSWRAQLYGSQTITADNSLPLSYRRGVATGLIPAPTSAQETYRAGLAAFDAFAREVYGTSFSNLQHSQQDVLLAASASPGPGSAPVAPAAARALFPVVLVNTVQGSFALPEYGGNRDAMMWRWQGFDGDTQPRGNTIYDPRLRDGELGPDQGHNSGFGEPGVYEPEGGYRQFRPVSTLGPDAYQVLGPGTTSLPSVERFPLSKAQINEVLGWLRTYGRSAGKVGAP